MRRRQFLGLVGGVAAWPVVARGQQPAKVGFLNTRSSRETTGLSAAFQRGLQEMGFIQGANVDIDYRWADGRTDRLPALAEDLVAKRVSVIATGGGPAAALAAKSATSTIPIVFSGGSDPVTAGLVASISRPGGNVTGILNIASDLTAKRLQLLRQIVPSASRIGALRNPTYPESDTQLKEIAAAAQLIGVEVSNAAVADADGFDPAIQNLIKQRIDALLIANDPFFAAQRTKLVPVIANHRMPAIFAQREYTEAGGLLSYGTNFADVYRQAGIYTGRILKGDLPSDLPVMQPTRFELVLNLKTARALGIDFPLTLLALADEVIE